MLQDIEQQNAVESLSAQLFNYPVQSPIQIGAVVFGQRRTFGRRGQCVDAGHTVSLLDELRREKSFAASYVHYLVVPPHHLLRIIMARIFSVLNGVMNKIFLKLR